MAGGRVDEVADNVFAVSGRINSTWGGGLVDMVRSPRLLEIIEADGLIETAGGKGERFVAGLRPVAETVGGAVTNVRGRGLMVALDLPDGTGGTRCWPTCESTSTYWPCPAATARSGSGRPCRSPTPSWTRRSRPSAVVDRVGPETEQAENNPARRQTPVPAASTRTVCSTRTDTSISTKSTMINSVVDGHR